MFWKEICAPHGHSFRAPAPHMSMAVERCQEAEFKTSYTDRLVIEFLWIPNIGSCWIMLIVYIYIYNSQSISNENQLGFSAAGQIQIGVRPILLEETGTFQPTFITQQEWTRMQVLSTPRTTNTATNNNHKSICKNDQKCPFHIPLMSVVVYFQLRFTQ